MRFVACWVGFSYWYTFWIRRVLQTLVDQRAMKDFVFTLLGKERPTLKDGRWKEFNKRGELISVGTYIHGQKHGHWKEYYDTGELMLEETYQHGVAHGSYTTYHPNGLLMSEGNYVNGSREGYFKVYTEEGIHYKSLFFINDVLMEEVDEIG